MENNITPGKWSVYKLDKRLVVDDNDLVIADVRTALDTADAMAISLVPDMVKIVQKLKDYYLLNSDDSRAILFELVTKSHKIAQKIQSY